MVWTISFKAQAEKDLARLDKAVQRRILSFLSNRIAPVENPRLLGAALSGPYRGLWKYRVGDYRIICEIQQEIVTVLVIEIGHRSEIYR